MSPSVPIQLLRLALPHIPTTGFTIQSLTLASLSLPAPHTPPPPGYSLSTISALFPSPPPRPSTSSRSLSREELRADAQGRLPERGERVGPAKALVEEWLEEGRRVMVKRVLEVGKGEKGVREGLRARVRYNQPVLAQLVEALALLSSSTSTALSSPSALLPFPSPVPHLAHVARIAQDLAKATGDESQGVDWYATRTRLGTIYGLAELHQVSPSFSPLSESERIESTLELVDRLLEHSGNIKKSVADAELFAQWVSRSWMGMGRSLGL